jgi:hypothetical protein
VKLRGTTLILAVGLGAAALLGAPPARAQDVRVQIAPTGSDAAAHGAAGLLVPGRGPAFSREEALAALGKIPPARCPCPYTIFVSLPRPGEHGYEGLEWLSISGPGYRAGAMLVSDRTRIPGLVSIFDLKPTVEALDHGEKPPVTAKPVDDVLPRLERLGKRLDAAHETREPAALALVGAIVLFALLGLRTRSTLLARAALLAAPVALTSALALSALEVTEPWIVVASLAAITVVGALVLAAMTARQPMLAVALFAIFPLYLLVLSWSTETSSFAAIGARPENGGRFYGFQNQVETLLLVPGLLGAALAGRRLFIPVALLVLVTVGASFAGADGGGVLVFAAGYLFLWLRLRDVPLTARNLVLAGAVVVGVAVALVGIDAALGGSSHVTRALGGGPVNVLGDMAHRLRLSAGGLVSSRDSALIIAASLPVFTWVASRRPRFATVDAVLVAVAVSLLVNDSPRDVAGIGALSCAALRIWKDVRRVQ